MKVAVLLENGFEELEAMGPIALLRRGGLDVDMIGVNNEEQVTGRFGITYSSVYPMNTYDFSNVDCLVLPGGPHYQKLEKNEEVLKLVHEFAENKVLAAICASPTILGHEGILKGKKYTCIKDMDEVFGLIDTSEKAAEVYTYVCAQGGVRQTISDVELWRLAEAFGVTPKVGYLEEKVSKRRKL